MANRLNNNRRKDDGPDSYRVIQFEGSAKHPQRAGLKTKRVKSPDFTSEEAFKGRCSVLS